MRRLLLLAVVLAIPLAACGTSGHVPPAHTSTRIISLVPAATEMLFAIGAGPRVIAVSSFDHYPPAVERLPRVGGLLDPDIERIIALRPDLVVVFAGQVELAGKLAQAGIRTFTFPRPTVASIIDALWALGRETGLVQAAEREARTMTFELDAVGQRVKGLPRPRTMLVIGREPGTLRNIFVSGGYGFLSDVLNIAGGENILGRVRRENLQVSSESILADQPEVIIEVVASQPWSAEQIERERHVWDALPAVPAVRDGRVYLLIGDEFVAPGPRLVQAARRLAQVLHSGS